MRLAAQWRGPKTQPSCDLPLIKNIIAVGLRRFRVRGLAKIRAEAMWAALTYNVQQWIRLRWRPLRRSIPAT